MTNLKQLKAGGLMKQREPDLFSVRLRIVGGHVEAHQMVLLGKLAEQFGNGHVHLTARQGVEIPGVHIDHVDALRERLAKVGLEFGACGRRVRTITACQGGSCSYGLIDPQALARRIDSEFYGRGGLPHKFKITITGCPNACMKPLENDLGIMGNVARRFDSEACNGCGLCERVCPVDALSMEERRPLLDAAACVNCGKCADACPRGAWQRTETRYVVFVGGKMGKRPRTATRLPFRITEADKLMEVIDRTIEWYARNGVERERFGTTIDRLGIEKLESWLADQCGLSQQSAP